MKKSNFIALLLGTVSVMLLALGMCMVSLPEWNAFRPGVVLGCAGILVGLFAVFVWRRMEHKPPIRVCGKNILSAAVGVLGALVLGIGMCFCMVWNKLPLGIAIGLAGMVILLCLIPLTKGLKD